MFRATGLKTGPMMAGIIMLTGMQVACQGEIAQHENEPMPWEQTDPSTDEQNPAQMDGSGDELTDPMRDEPVVDEPDEPTDTPDPGMMLPDTNACAQPDATPLRRLSHFEYWNTLHALYPEASLPNTELPQDARSYEFDNEAESMIASNVLTERYLEIAQGVVDALKASGEFSTMVDCAPTATDAASIKSCGETFVRQEGERLFRRPLTSEMVETYSVMFNEDFADATFEERQSLTLQLLLSSPEFLYRFEAPDEGVEPGASVPLDSWALASRLSYFLWGQAPDDELRELARTDELKDPAVLKAQAERMLDDPRSREVFMHMHELWLELERVEHVTKYEEDGFDHAMKDAMISQGMMFVDEVLYNDQGTIADLFSSTRTFVNADLARIYNVEPPEQGWVEMNFEQRTGWLTQPAFLASHAHPDKSSPVLRGTFVLSRVLCTPPGAPPPAAEAAGNAIADEIVGPLTNRERYELTTNSQFPCTSCHQSINPLGYSMEHFDTMGRWIEKDSNDLNIETHGELGDFVFDDIQDLSKQLSTSNEVEACVTKKWLRYAWSNGPLESSSCLQEDVLEAARIAGDDSIKIRNIQLAIVTHPWFATYTAPAAADTEAPEENE